MRLIRLLLFASGCKIVREIKSHDGNFSLDFSREKVTAVHVESGGMPATHCAIECVYLMLAMCRKAFILRHFMYSMCRRFTIERERERGAQQKKHIMEMPFVVISPYNLVLFMG